MNQELERKIKYCLSLTLITAISSFTPMGMSNAHAPHDVVSEISISPNFENDKTIITIVRGTLLRSKDGGETWKRIVKGLENRNNLTSISTSSIDQKIVYLSSEKNGIYKSNDYGLSWENFSGNLDESSIKIVEVSPHNSHEILAAGVGGGLYKTTNSGNTWEEILDKKTKISSIKISDQLIDTYIVGTEKGKVFVSEDKGKNWKSKDIGVQCKVSSLAIALEESVSPKLFVGTKKCGLFSSRKALLNLEKEDEYFSGKSIESIQVLTEAVGKSNIYLSTSSEGIFFSNDNGKNWKNLNQGLTRTSQAEKFSRPHFTEILLSPNFRDDETIFLAGFNGLFKSENSGDSWTEINTLSSELVVGLDVSPAHDKDSTIAISSYLGGAYLSNDGGELWSPINNGLLAFKKILNTGQINRIFSVRFSPNYIEDNSIFSSSWLHFLISENSGETWKNISTNTKNVGAYIAFDKEHPGFQSIFLGTIKGDILRSENKGRSFSKISNLKEAVEILKISPNFNLDRTMFAVTKGNIYKSINEGSSWQPILIFKDRVVTSIDFLADSSEKTAIIASTDRGLYINRGEIWKPLDNNLKDKYIEALAVSPNFSRDKILIASVSGEGLFKSNDGGMVFDEVGRSLIDDNHLLSNFNQRSNLTAQPIVFSPTFRKDNTVYGYSESNIFKSIDGGDTWQKYNVSNIQKRKVQLLFYEVLNSPVILVFICLFIVLSLVFMIIFKMKLTKFEGGN